MELIKEFAAWLWAVLTIWQAYMTGGIVIAVLGIYERVAHKTISTRTFLIGVAVFLVMATFLAWREQRHAAATMQKKFDELTQPKLIGEIDQAGSVGRAVDEHGKLFIDMTDTGIFVFATIKNIGSPSVVVNWNLVVHIPGKAPMEAAKRLLPATMRLDRQSMMYGEDALYNKAVNSPVPTGGQDPVCSCLCFRALLEMSAGNRERF